MGLEEKASAQSLNTRLLSDGELRQALLFVIDIFDRCQIPFFVLGDTAKQIKESYTPILESDKLEVGVMRGALHKPLYDLLEGMFPENFTRVRDKTNMMRYITFEYAGVPVSIRIFSKDYGVFDNPEIRFFDVEQVYIPNPFEVYWQKKGIL